MSRFAARFALVRNAIAWWRALQCRILHHRPERLSLSLIWNAFDADPEGGRYWMQVQRCLRCAKVLNEFLIEVRNEGHGMERIVCEPVKGGL